MYVVVRYQQSTVVVVMCNSIKNIRPFFPAQIKTDSVRFFRRNPSIFPVFSMSISVHLSRTLSSVFPHGLCPFFPFFSCLFPSIFPGLRPFFPRNASVFAVYSCLFPSIFPELSENSNPPDLIRDPLSPTL